MKIFLRVTSTENDCHIIFEPEVIDKTMYEKFSICFFLSCNSILFISTKRL